MFCRKYVAQSIIQTRPDHVWPHNAEDMVFDVWYFALSLMSAGTLKNRKVEAFNFVLYRKNRLVESVNSDFIRLIW